MIPNRLLFRAATVLALTRGGQPPYPTMAGGLVYDTRIVPISDIAQEAMLPVILVYTDSDSKTNVERNGRPKWKRMVHLVIEIAISSATKDAISRIETDAELEALLDFFEAEVEAALFDPTNEWAVLWRTMTRCIENWTSEPYRSADQASRYAVRQIFMEVELAPECAVEVTTEEVLGKVQHNLDQIPYLAPLAEQIEKDEVFASTRRLLTSPGLVTLPRLRGISLVTPAATANIKMED